MGSALVTLVLVFVLWRCILTPVAMANGREPHCSACDAITTLRGGMGADVEECPTCGLMAPDKVVWK